VVRWEALRAAQRWGVGVRALKVSLSDLALNPDKIRQPTSNQYLPFASRDRPLFAEVCKTLGTPLVNQASAFKATRARYSAP
jgi:hypothetical protein